MIDWWTRIAWWRLLVTHRWTYVLGIAGVVLSLVTLSLQSWGTATGALLGIGIGVVGLVTDSRAWKKAQRDLLIRPADVHGSDTWTVSGDLARAGYVLDPSEPASVHSTAVNRALQSGADAPLELLGRRPPRRPDGIHAAVILRRHFRSGAHLFNGAKVSQLDDLRLVDDVLQPVRLREARYFDGLITNEFAGWEIQGRGGQRLFCGDTLFVDGDSILPLAQSDGSNAVGASTLAMTSDAVLVISRQGERSAVAAGLLAPSGSGSADWADARAATGLRDFVLRVAERELLEECGLPVSTPCRSELLAFARFLHRGGKPEFFCFTHLGVPYAEINVRRQERNLMFEHEALRIDQPDQFRERVSQFANSNQASLSPVLRAHLRFFDDALAAGWSPFATRSAETGPVG